MLGRPVVICADDGKPLLPTPQQADRKSPQPESQEVPITLKGKAIGLVRSVGNQEKPIAPSTRDLLNLPAEVLGRLCESKIELRSRIEQLRALHRVTAQFTEGQNLQGILDTITQTVVNAMGARASTIRLLSENGEELLIKSGCNISREYLNKGAIRLPDSQIDQLAIRDRQPVYIADLSSDPRVLYSAEAKREGLVSGLCAAMFYKNKCEGVLRVYMGERHKFDWFESQLLQTIANSGAAAIAHARLNDEAELSWRMKRQLAMAGEVQQRMIPDSPPSIEGLDIHAEYVPSHELAGDFYDYIDLPPDNVGIAICDVVGKGVRASLLMASIRASLRAHAINLYDMSEVLKLVNHDLCADTKISDFATMFYGVLNKQTKVFTYSCAGHIPPLLVRDERISHLDTAGGVLGIFPDMEYPQAHIELQPGDVLLAYTDGLNEASNFEDEQYGRTRVEAALLFAVDQGYSAENITRHCLWDMRRFAGLHRRQDDTTLIAIRVSEI